MGKSVGVGQEGPGLGMDGLGEVKLGVGDLQTQGWRRPRLGEKCWAQVGLGEVKGWGAHLCAVGGGIVSVDISLKLLSRETKAKVRIILGHICSSLCSQSLSKPWGLPLEVSGVDPFALPASTLATPILTPHQASCLSSPLLSDPTQTPEGPVNTQVRPRPASAQQCARPRGPSEERHLPPCGPR